MIKFFLLYLSIELKCLYFYSGWQGLQCSRSCSTAKFGPNCTEQCSCFNGASCEPISGNCTCGPGHFGDKCQETCQPGYHGFMCESRCACVGPNVEGCNPETGECICKPGFRGQCFEFLTNLLPLLRFVHRSMCFFLYKNYTR